MNWASHHSEFSMNPSPTFRLRFLGSPSLSTADGTRLSGPEIQRHRLALLALLTLAPDQALSRDRLIAYLWPERNTDGARQLLNQAVYRIRKALGDEVILSQGEDLQLNREVVSADVTDFEAALARGDDEHAVSLYEGPFADGFFVSEAPELEQWIAQTRDRLAWMYARRLEALAEAAEQRADLAGAVAWWKARATHDPLDSRIAIRLIQCLNSAGNRAGALRHAAVHERLLKEGMGIDLDPEVAALVERLRKEPAREWTAEPAGESPRGVTATPGGDTWAERPPIDPGRAGAADLDVGDRDYAEVDDPATVGVKRPQPEGAATPAFAAGDLAPPALADAQPTSPAAGAVSSISGARDGTAADPATSYATPSDSRSPAGLAGVQHFSRPASASRLGYGARRRLAVVAAVLAIAAGAAWTVWARSSPPELSIAVLPFVNLSTDEENEFFSDGLTEEIITRLAGVPNLKVISRTSAMRYKGSTEPLRTIAEQLRVAHILQGSVRRSEGRLRVTAQLLDASTDEHRWAETFDFEGADIFVVQEEIARNVADALRVRLTPRSAETIARQARAPEVYDLYRRGRFHWATRTREGHRLAIDYYQRAIERDSTFAEGYAGLADAYATSWQMGLSNLSEAETNARIEWAANRALALDSLSSDAHTSAGISLIWKRDWPGAERELRRAIQLNPGNGSARSFLAMQLRGIGRTEESMRESRRAADSDPFALIVSIDYANACYIARDYGCAVEQYKRTLELNDRWAPTYTQLGLTYSAMGRHEDAIAAVSRAMEVSPRSAVYRADLAYVHARAGRGQEAAEILRQVKAMGSTPPFPIARAHIALDEADSAFVWLDRVRWQWPPHGVRSDPALDPLRTDTRFVELSARIDREMGIR